MDFRKWLGMVSLAVLCLVLAKPGLAQQSLADIARQQHEKEAQSGATPQVYTNKDLPHEHEKDKTTPTAETNSTSEKKPVPIETDADAAAMAAMKVLATKIHPGSKVSGYKLVLPGGAQKPFQIMALIGVKVASGWFYVGAVEFEGDQATAMAAMVALKPASPSHTYIFAFYLDAAGHLRSYKKGILDAHVPVTQIDEFHIPSAPKDGSWPLVHVLAWHWYSSKNWTGGVHFVSEIDTTAMTVVERLPVAIQKKPNNADSIDDNLTSERENGKLLIKGLPSKKTMPYVCPERCIVDGERLLDVW